MVQNSLILVQKLVILREQQIIHIYHLVNSEEFNKESHKFEERKKTPKGGQKHDGKQTKSGS